MCVCVCVLTFSVRSKNYENEEGTVPFSPGFNSKNNENEEGTFPFSDLSYLDSVPSKVKIEHFLFCLPIPFACVSIRRVLWFFFFFFFFFPSRRKIK